MRARLGRHPHSDDGAITPEPPEERFGLRVGLTRTGSGDMRVGIQAWVPRRVVPRGARRTARLVPLL
jgi:hypothetical protein